jgi:hypothetical protein
LDAVVRGGFGKSENTIVSDSSVREVGGDGTEHLLDTDVRGKIRRNRMARSIRNDPIDFLFFNSTRRHYQTSSLNPSRNGFTNRTLEHLPVVEISLNTTVTLLCGSPNLGIIICEPMVVHLCRPTRQRMRLKNRFARDGGLLIGFDRVDRPPGMRGDVRTRLGLIDNRPALLVSSESALQSLILADQIGRIACAYQRSARQDSGMTYFHPAQLAIFRSA